MLKEKIINLFFKEHLQLKEISNIVHTSSAYITKVIKQDARYDEEKSIRSNKSKENRKISQNKFIKNKREKQRLEDNYLAMKAEHNQAVSELSERKHLTNEDYRKWNYSAYKYNPSKRRYEFDENLGRSYDVPKYIKER